MEDGSISPAITQSEELLENVLHAEFIYGSGRTKDQKGYGTCFTLSDKSGRSFLITNRHNIDYFSFRDENPDDLRLCELIVHRRWRRGDKPAVKWPFRLQKDAKIWVDPNKFNDVAIIENKIEPIGDPPKPMYGRNNFYFDMIADEKLFEKIPLATRVNFVGFPSRVWDHQNSLPILRESVISSVPNLDYSALDQKAASRILVTGMSFSGSSGSPVFEGSSGVLIGIMAGHYCRNTNADALSADTDTFFENDASLGNVKAEGVHSGLSYFIKSSVIKNIRMAGKEFPWGGEWDHEHNRWKEPIE